MAKTNTWREKRGKSVYVYEQDYRYDSVTKKKIRIGKKRYIGRVIKDENGNEIILPPHSANTKNTSRQVEEQRKLSITHKKSVNDKILYKYLQAISVLKEAESNTDFSTQYSGMIPKIIILFSDSPDLLLLKDLFQSEFVKMNLFKILELKDGIRPVIIMPNIKELHTVKQNLYRKNHSIITIEPEAPELSITETFTNKITNINYEGLEWSVKELKDKRIVFGITDKIVFETKCHKVEKSLYKAVLDAYHLIKRYEILNQCITKAPESLKIALLDFAWNSIKLT